MSSIARIALACLLSLAITMVAEAAPVFGSYRGFVTNERLKRDQLVKIELIHSRGEDGSLRLRAILTLQFGGYESAEYVSYHFEDVGYNIVNGVLTFNQNDQDVHLSSVRIRNGTISGTLHSSVGVVGPFQASNTSQLVPKNPLIEPLGGEYRGKCEGVSSSLQIMTYRSTKDTTRLGNPFGVYEAKGQLGNVKRSYCSDGPNDFCTYTKIDNVSYNFYVGDLVATGYPFGLNCRVNGSELNCGSCNLKRVSLEMKKPQLWEELSAEDPFAEVRREIRRDSNSPIRGQYVGYVYHEHLKIYQRVELDVATYDQASPDGTKLQLSAVANLRFGTSDNEVISYRFDPVPFPNPVMAPEFVLSRPGADVDAVLSIKKVIGGTIEGIWYSMIFGRVGAFIVTQNGDLPTLPESQLIGGVASGYEEVGGAGVIAKVFVGKGNAPIGSDNPFDPLTFGGYVWRRAGTTVKEGIGGGSYDFYTGRIGLLYGDAILSGFLIPGRDVELRRLGGGFGTVMQKFPTTKYKKTDRLP